MLVENYHLLLAMTMDDRKEFAQQNPTIFDDIFDKIGLEEAAIRDQLNYRLFVLLLSENTIDRTVILQYVDRLSSKDGLLFNIGEKGTTSVLQRSYSALFLTAIVHADRQLHYLSIEQLEILTRHAVDLLSKEQDLRSLIDAHTGWAHSVAHTCELLGALIEHPDYPIRFTAQILQAIRANLWKGTVFVDDEEERFCNVIQALLLKNIDEALFIEWFEQLFERLEIMAFERGYDAEWFKARTNQLNLAKTLYFYLKFANRNEKLRSIVSGFIQRWLKLN